MGHPGQDTQIEFLIEVSVDVFEHAVHPRRIFSLVGFPGQTVSDSENPGGSVLEIE